MKLRRALGRKLLNALEEKVVFNKQVRTLLRSELSGIRGIVLDVGCGNFPEYLGFSPGDEYVGVDMQPTRYAQVLCDVANLPFRGNVFDNAICSAVMEHVLGPAAALAELRRVLRDAGILWVSFPFLSPYHPHPHDLHRWTLHGALHECRKAGFEVDCVFSFNGLAMCIDYLTYTSLSTIGVKRPGYFLYMAGLFLLNNAATRIFRKDQSADERYSLGYFITCKKLA